MAKLVQSDVRANLRNFLKDTNSGNYTWTDDELNQYILDGVRFCSRGRRPKIWNESEDESLTTVASQDTYDVPTGIIQIFEIWIQGQSGGTTYKNIRKFRVFNDKIRFALDYVPSLTGLTIRLKAATKMTTITDVDEEYEDIIRFYASHLAMESLTNDLSKFNTYSASLQDIKEKDVERLASRYYNTAERELAKNAKPYKPVYMGGGQY